MRKLAIILILFLSPLSAFAAVAYQSIASSNFSTATSLVITKPTGLTAGDLMLAYVMNNAADFSTPTGWTAGPAHSGANPRQAVFYKIASSADASATNFTFSWGGSSTEEGGFLMRFNGTDQSSPIDQTVSNFDPGGVTTPTLTGITPTVANTYFVMMTIADNGTAIRTVSGYQIATNNPTWTEALDQGATPGSRARTMAVAYASRPETTSSGTAQYTFSGAEANVFSVLLNIKPPAAVVTAPSIIGLVHSMWIW